MCSAKCEVCSERGRQKSVDSIDFLWAQKKPKEKSLGFFDCKDENAYVAKPLMRATILAACSRVRKSLGPNVVGV